MPYRPTLNQRTRISNFEENPRNGSRYSGYLRLIYGEREKYMAYCNSCRSYFPDSNIEVHSISCFANSASGGTGVSGSQTFASSFSQGFENAQRNAEAKRANDEAKAEAARQRKVELEIAEREKSKSILVANGIEPDIAEAHARNLQSLNELSTNFKIMHAKDQVPGLNSTNLKKMIAQVIYWGFSLIFLSFSFLAWLGLTSTSDGLTEGGLKYTISMILIVIWLLLTILITIYGIYSWIQFGRSIDSKIDFSRVKMDKFSRRFFARVKEILENSREEELSEHRESRLQLLNSIKHQVDLIPVIPFLDPTEFRSKLTSEIARHSK